MEENTKNEKYEVYVDSDEEKYEEYVDSDGERNEISASSFQDAAIKFARYYDQYVCEITDRTRNITVRRGGEERKFLISASISTVYYAE